MSLDPLFRRHFGLVLLGLLAIMAYFQARGISNWIAGRLTVPAASQAPKTPRPKPSSSARINSADAILERNAFDSTTGPLLDLSTPDAGPEEDEDPDDPLLAPPCEGLRAIIVSEALDPKDSLATAQVPGETTPRLLHVGETVGDRTLVHIGYNAAHASSAIWLWNETSLCQALVHPRAPSGADGGAPPAAITRPTHAAAPADILAKIEKVSDTHYRIDRSAFTKIMENKLEWLRARITPEKKDGEIVGMRLRGVRKEGLLRALGLKNDDRIDALNGKPLNDPGAALQAFSSMTSAKRLTLTGERNGKPLTLEFDIE